MRAIIDTCVILDYLQGREPFFDDALNIAIGSANREFEGYITANSITDLYYIVRKATHSDKKTRRIVSKLLEVFGLVDTLAEDCVNALSSGITDYEDAVMEQSALRSNIDCLVTRNVRDYSKSRVKILTPSDFLLQFGD